MTEPAILKFFADYIETQLGIVYTDTNYFQLEYRLRDISHQLGLKDINDLYTKARISIEGSFKNLLLDLATNNETSFYRDAHVFKALGKFILPDIMKLLNDPTTINIWSAASSSGQEIYTIAMEMDSLRRSNPALPQCTYFATDISDSILKRAKEGIYTQLEVQRGLPAKNLIEYFDQCDGTLWKVKESLRSNITFKKLNLLEPWGPIGPFEIIYCRNVLIYQNVENKKRVVNQLLTVLRPGGYLILGAAESMFGISDDFDQVTDDKTIVYRKKR
jgi:chemotaxis protein methyltransferase CheR